MNLWRKTLTKRSLLTQTAAAAGGAAAVTSACVPFQIGDSGGAPASSGVAGTIRWSYWANDGLAPIYDQIVDRFQQEYPKVKVEKERASQGTGEWTPRVLAQIAGGDPPDVIEQTPQHLTDFSGQGALIDLKPLMTAHKLDTGDFFEGGIRGGVRSGKQFGLPFNIFFHTIFYNKRHFRERGLATPAANWTWDDLLDAARKLTSDTGSQKQWGFHASTGQWMNSIVPRIWQNGGEVLSADETQCLLDRKPAIDAVQWWFDMANKWQVAPTRAELEAERPVLGDPTNAIRQQRVSIVSWGTWLPSQLNITPDLEWDLQAWPVPRGGKRATALGQLNVAITQGTKAPDASWAFVVFQIGKEAQLIHAINGDWSPARKSVAADPKAQAGLGSNKNFRAIITELEAGRPGINSLVRWTDLNRFLNPAMDQIFGGAAASVVLTEATRQINEALKNPPK
ncbi:MAG: extracellular solute-binding protein [Chloroflexi bacterium]|nr:extracellular solute-binding protein [Chloroflexota bacterium]